MREELAPEAANPALGDRVLPRTSGRRSGGFGTHGLHESHHLWTDDGVLIEYEMLRCAFLPERLASLLGHPRGREIRRDVEVHDASSSLPDHEQHVEHSQGGRTSRIFMQPSEDRRGEGRARLGIQQRCTVPLLVRDDDPVRLDPRTGVFATDGTTLQFNAHDTETRTVCYPWHPWYGHTIAIRAARAKRDQAICHCQLEHDVRLKSLEIPQWMLDPAICTAMRRRETPVVSSEALLNLKALLVHTTVCGDSAVVQNQSHSMSTKGETDATDPRSTIEGSTRHISPTSTRARLANATASSKRTDRETAGAAVSRASTGAVRSR